METVRIWDLCTVGGDWKKILLEGWRVRGRVNMNMNMYMCLASAWRKVGARIE